MPNDHYRYALELLRKDGTPAGQYPVDVDWEPVRQWLRFEALRRDARPDPVGNGCPARPRWDEARGKPYVDGFRPVPTAVATAEEEPVIPTAFLAPQATNLASQLVADGVLEAGVHTFRVLAFPQEEPAPPRFRLDVEPLDVTPPVAAGDLAELGARSEVADDAGECGLPAFIPRRVLDECRRASAAAGGQETGGILIGGLRRDAREGTVFLVVSAQIAARHVVAGEASLAFTPETWTDVQGTIDLRGRGEIMLGWWHSHPVKAWCADCPAEKRRQCPLLQDYFSAQDRLLHRTVFPAAYSLALVVNELADDERTLSLFGWERGQVVQRGFRVLENERVATEDRTPRHAGEEAR